MNKLQIQVLADQVRDLIGPDFHPTFVLADLTQRAQAQCAIIEEKKKKAIQAKITKLISDPYVMLDVIEKIKPTFEKRPNDHM
jgi:hypothetical protein